METRRLQVLYELARLGSMTGVAEHLGTSTSTVSQQVSALGRELGVDLTEPDGRRVRLTPPGRRLAAHAATILRAVDAARADLDPDTDPAGTVRVSGFATAIRRTLMPAVEALGATHPGVTVVLSEHEPAEALALLDSDEVDLALTYDYNLAPDPVGATVRSVALWSTAWSLGVPAQAAPGVGGDALTTFGAFRNQGWIGNSRNRADEDVVRVVASMAGFQPRFSHRADSLDLVEDLIVAGMGVGLLPADRPARDGVALLALTGPEVLLRAYARVRHGREGWPPLAVLLKRLAG